MLDLATDGPPLTGRDFSKIQTLVYRHAGIDLRDGKQTLVSSRLGKQVRSAGCRTYAEFLAVVESDTTGESLNSLIDALTTNYTFFFREPSHFRFLQATVLPKLNGRATVEIWCAAAATGEEPYTLAMLLLEAFGPGSALVLATDISSRALRTARRGIYSAERLASVPADLLRKYWLRGEGGSAGQYKTAPHLARAVEFRKVNLIQPFSMSRTYPVIFCRNVMIYFDRTTQKSVAGYLSRALEPGGYLFVGHSESLAAATALLEQAGPAIYRKPSQGR